MFKGEDMKDFAKEYGFNLVYATPYYAQASGQAKAINKSLILEI